MSGGPPLLLHLYRAATRLAAPLGPRLLARRLAAGKEDGARLGERMGVAGRPRPAGPLVWLHAASVGETNAIVPLAGRLAATGANVLVTTVTITGAEVAARRLPEGAFHQFLPLDLPGPVADFLDHWRPDLALFAEQELWPNMILAAEARGIPLAIVNGRMSPRSAARWLRAPASARRLLGAFSLVAAGGTGDAERFRIAGARAVTATGNLKFDTAPLAADPDEAARLAAALAGRPVWAAVSTQPGEEEIVLAAHRAASASLPGLALLLAPRHPPRGDAVADLVSSAGLTMVRRSRRDWPDASTEVFLIDTIGDLGLVYRTAPVAFLGKSLDPVGGGQNPIEAAQLGAAVVHGPKTVNFAEVYAALDGVGGAVAVADGVELGAAIGRLLADAEAARTVAFRARAILAESAGALERTMTALAPLLPARLAEVRP